jgi:hypothetical protein
MNKRSLIKYKHDNETGLMYYVILEGEVVSLSKCDAKKVSYIKEKGMFDIDQNIFD